MLFPHSLTTLTRSLTHSHSPTFNLMFRFDEEDEMGDFIVDEGPEGQQRARRRRAMHIPGVSAAALEVRGRGGGAFARAHTALRQC